MKRWIALPISNFILFLITLGVVLIATARTSIAQTTVPYSAAGTYSFTVPAGVTSVTVEAWGGGGAGAGQNNNKDGGGGGGGGAYSKKLSIPVVPGNSYDVVVGAGGAGATGNGADGGDSYFNNTTILLAKGGKGGLQSTGTPPEGGLGGSAAQCVGDINNLYSGGQGEKGENSNQGKGGYGGSSAGTGANGISGPQTWQTNIYPTTSTPAGGGNGGNGGTSGNNGSAGAPPGGGGGGSGEGSNKVGGSGGAGQVKITYTCTTYSITGILGTVACTSIGTSTITVNSTATGLPKGNYIVTYDRTAPSGTGLTATMTVTTAGTGTFIASGLSTAGNSTIKVTNLASGSGNGSNPLCSSAISLNNTAIITVNSVPDQPGIITGNTAPCEGSVQTYSVSSVAGVTYNWTLPSGWTQTGGGTSNSITVTVGTGSGSIQVTPSNNCGNGIAQSLAVTVSSIDILGFPGSRCGAGTGVITLSAWASAGTIKWYDSNGVYLSSGATFTTPVLNTTTTYYAEATNGICISARIPVKAYIITPPSLSASGGGTYCYDTNISLNCTFSGADNVYWDGPNGYYSTLANPVLSNATPAMSGTYKVTSNALSGINLITNGDFEKGNTGFVSSYIYNNISLQNEGTYAVVANPNSVHTGFSNCTDHSSPDGIMQMVINGAVASGVTVWSQTVNVVPDTYYQFTYWVQSVVGNNPSKLELYINGVSAGNVYTASTATCNWGQFIYTWPSGNNTSAKLELVNRNTEPNGNDFALDDIVFQHTCTSSASVNVTVNAEVTAGLIGGTQTICQGVTPVAITSTAAGTGSGTISYIWQTNASGSYVTIPGATSATYSPPALNSTTSYRRMTVSNSGGVTCYSGYTNEITVTVSGPVSIAGGPNTVCQSASPTAITLSGSSYSGVGTTGAAWSIVSGGGVLSSSLSTTTPSNVTYTPASGYSGDVKLWLTTAGGSCNAVSERIIHVVPSAGAVAGTTITTCSNSGAVNITAGSSASNYASVLWTSNGTGTFTNANSLTLATYTPSAADIAAGSITLTLTAYGNSPCGNAVSTKALTITALPSATISYAGSPFCKSVNTAQAVTLTGTGGGTYSASPAGLSINGSTGDIVPGASIAGTYTVTYTMAASGGCSQQIATTSVTVTAVPTATISYPGSPFCNSVSALQPVTISGTGAYTGGTFSASAGLSINSLTGAISPSSSTPGTYTVTYTIPSSGGCSAIPVNAQVIITDLPVASFSYSGSPYCSNASNPSPVFSGGGVAGTFSSTAGLVFVSTSTGQVNIAASTPGTYTVTNTIAASGGCATVTATSTITIAANPSAPTANNVILTYDGLSHSASAIVASGETIDWYTSATGGSVTTAPTGTNVGIYSAYAEARNTTSGCLSTTRTLVTLTINPASLSITANNVNKVYGTSLTGVSGSTAFTASGLQNGQTIGTVTIAYGTGLAANAAVGTYPGSVTPSAATGGTFTASNYSITYYSGNIIIAGAPLTVTANGPAKTYGTALTAGTNTTNFTVSGTLLAGESLTGVTLTPNAEGLSATTAAGQPYTVTPSMATGTGGFLASNYAITYNTYNGMVAKKALTITATAKSKTYGTVQATPVVGSTAFTSSGLVGSETIGSVTLTYAAGALAANSPVNSTSVITPSGATGGTFLASNYTITYNTALLTVTPKALTITANNQSKTYGTTINFVGTEFTASGLVNSDAVTRVTLTSAGSIATANVTGSPYTIVPSAATGTGLSNYAITYTNGTMTVTKALLTVTANNQSKVYDGLVFNPFTVSYSGFVNGETSAVLGGSLSYSGTATTARNVGTGYVIIPTGLTSNNYNISFSNGALTITAAPLTPLVTANNKCFDGSTQATLSSQTLSGVFSPDVVNLVVGSSNFSDATVGIGKTVSAMGLSLSGASAGNYILSSNTATATATIYALPTASMSGSASICNGSSASLSIHLTGNGPWSFTYTDGVTPVTITGHATSTYNFTVSPGITTTYTLTAVSDAHCMGTDFGSSATVVVTNLPTATLSYGTPFCSNEGVQPVILNGTGGYIGGTFTATPAGLSMDAATGAITPAASEPRVYTVTYTIAAFGGCAVVTANTQVTINRDGSWTGVEDDNWNNLNNWACKQLPTLATDVVIASGKQHYPLLTSEVTGQAHDINIESEAMVTVTGGRLQIAGAIRNSGTFTATEGTIEMAGSAAQTIGVNVFDTNTLMNLVINNPSEVTLLGKLNITGVVSPALGTFNAGGYLTLLSTPGKTALIDGVGTGNVTGYVNMERYLSSPFGYKYFSSPFKAATVAEFEDEMNLTETFPTFYKYDENHSRDSLGITVYYSGWTKYIETSNALVPMIGYAANMGTGTDPITVTMRGVVNNGELNTTLYNHNRKYTKGFNLVGNPYPSPIDWNATGWTRDKIDGAIYFFNAGNTNRYTGVYTSYVNGASTGSGDNIIAAMQGFFVHVTDPALKSEYPVSATLGMSNSVRTNNLNPIFKSAVIDSRPMLRLKAGFAVNNAIEDVALVYFDPTAIMQFEKEKDALKIENTDEQVPNIYTIAPDHQKLSINGLSEPTDSVSFIPVGITTLRDGTLCLRAENANELPFMQVYLADGLTGQYHDLRQSPEMRFLLQKGIYDSRFKLVFSKLPFTGQYPGMEKMFTLTHSVSRVFVKVNLAAGTKGNLLVTNALGQVLIRKEVTGKETVEIGQDVVTGVYVVTLVSGKRSASEKILMRADYE